MEKQKRDMNFELLRIISMVLIVCSHYILNSNLLDTINKNSTNYFIIEFIRILTRTSVNLYVLITGYYMINSKMKLKKVANIWSTVIFYTISFMLFFLIIGLRPSMLNVIMSFLPITMQMYWFATLYIALYLLTPFLNKALKSLNKKQYKTLVLFLFVILVITDTISYNNIYIDAGHGRSLMWIVFLYMWGGYIRLHYSKPVNVKRNLFIVFVISLLITIIRFIALKIFNKDVDRLLNFSNLFIFINTTLIFLAFKNLKITNIKICNLIEKISPLMFGVYLIHENRILKQYLWEPILKISKYANSKFLILHFFISVILIMVICSAIEYCRIKLFALHRKENIIDKKLDKLNEKFWNMMEEKNEN